MNSCWLRLDVDNPCYYRAIRTRIRLRWNIPIWGYCEQVKDTLAYLKQSHPTIKRVWFIRHIILPPHGLLDDEEIGLHITEPHNVLKEYKKVSNHFHREFYKFTRHGHSPIASGRLWAPEDHEYVRSVLPHMVDLSDLPHYTISHSPDSKLDDALYTNFGEVDHVLFHPEHLKLNKSELDWALRQVEANNHAQLQ